MDRETRKAILAAQKSEITGHLIYERLSESTKDSHNREILKHISSDELKHYGSWKQHTQEDAEPDRLKIWIYLIISRIFGITFGMKLMERGEREAQATYEKIAILVPAAKSMVIDEYKHEKQLVDSIDEERLRYVGAILRGLNDALVKLTGALAGLTLILHNTRLIAAVGLITGIAATLSVAGSEYLATKSEESSHSPFKASVYTALAGVLTVLFVTFPYLLFTSSYLSLGFMILNAIIVIFIFTLYISVAKDLSFTNRFLEMTLISLGIAALTFAIGFLVRRFLGVEEI